MYGLLQFNLQKHTSGQYEAEPSSPVLRNQEADERGFQICVTVATLDRAIKSFEITDPWQFKQKPGVRNQGWSRQNILPGTEPPGQFMWRGVHARDKKPVLEPQHFVRNQNGTRIGAARTSYSEPEPQPQQILSQTPESESDSELRKIIDLENAVRYKIYLAPIGTLNF